MFLNYCKIALRNLWRHKSFSFINILGLSIGIAVSFVILLYVVDEISYDRFNAKADQIVRVVFQANINGGKINESNVMPPVAAVMQKDYPEIEAATRLRQYGTSKITYREKILKDEQVALVDPNFFDVFTVHFLSGNAGSALNAPNSIVITRQSATRFFGAADPIGKTLTLNNDELYTVTGVIDNLPATSHFHFDMFGTLPGREEAKSDSWMVSNYFTYLLLHKGYDYTKLEAKLPAMVEKYMGPQILKEMGMSLAQFRTKGNQLGFALQPLTSIHLHSHTTSELEPGGDMQYVYIFSAIALFMLLIACINFINLSTAGAAGRAKEVGIRKVMGSLRFDLVRQFLVEFLLIALFALFISFLLLQLALPVFNELSGKNLSLGIQLQPVVALISLSLLVGLLAGIYPAFYLSSFQPVAVLKGKFFGGVRSFKLRSVLVVFQFFISVSLIVSTIVVYRQMHYIQNKKLGYDKEHLLLLSNSYALGKNEQLFKQELLKDRRIVGATISAYKPAGPTNSNNSLAYPEGQDNQIMRTLEYHVDENYIPTLGMQLATGRNFSSDLVSDFTTMIINETAARAFGWGSNAIGKRIIRQNSDRGHNAVFTVIGVVKDFNFQSLHQPVTPLLMVLQPEWGIIVKVKTTDMAGLLSDIKQRWNTYQTGETFQYSFMDDLYNKTYAAEQKTGTILSIFAVLTILVACLGLFGLATYTAMQRTKEIGIRKVLGASVVQVTNMLSTEFLRLVIIACIIAFPLSFWAMHTWLQNFAYRISISWWMFVLAGCIAILIALLTVSFQSIKAAVANPVKSLRTE